MSPDATDERSPRGRMRYVLAAFGFAHGVAHLPAFAVSWQLLAMSELPYRTSILQGRLELGDAGIRVWGLVWLALAVAFAVFAVGVWTRASWWLRVLPIVVGISALCCILGLPEARMGLAANLVMLVLACAAIRFPGTSPPMRHAGLDQLWNSQPAGIGAVFDPAAIPDASRLYLQHAITPGTPLAASVRLRMHGEIKIGRWHRFHAEQLIVPKRGMIWAATVSMFGLPVRGSDHVLDGKGVMDWKLFDTVPIVHGEGADISRSGTGRLLSEIVAWLPAALCGAPARDLGVEWMAAEKPNSRLQLEWFGEKIELTIAFDDTGRVSNMWFPRWGNPDGGKSRYIDFGVVVEEERNFGGYTLPSCVRAGWYYGTDQFAAEGEFFHATIDDVEFK